VSIPPNRPLGRLDLNDVIYKNGECEDGRHRARCERTFQKRPAGALGTTSIAKMKCCPKPLTAAGVKHEVLNAKNNEREGSIVAQAGKPGAVTVATNMAGRGVDILLGGNPPSAEDAKRVREAGVSPRDRHRAA